MKGKTHGMVTQTFEGNARMCNDVTQTLYKNTHFQTCFKHTLTQRTSTFHQLDNGAGLTTKSLWYPHCEESQPGHETWMALFSTHTYVHSKSRTQTWAQMQEMSAKQIARHKSFLAVNWPVTWACDPSTRNVTFVPGQDNDSDVRSDVSHKSSFQVWTGMTVNQAGMCMLFHT